MPSHTHRNHLYLPIICTLKPSLSIRSAGLINGVFQNILILTQFNKVYCHYVLGIMFWVITYHSKENIQDHHGLQQMHQPKERFHKLIKSNKYCALILELMILKCSSQFQIIWKKFPSNCDWEKALILHEFTGSLGNRKCTKENSGMLKN